LLFIVFCITSIELVDDVVVHKLPSLVVLEKDDDECDDVTSGIQPKTSFIH
jgi:hypothetical protein